MPTYEQDPKELLGEDIQQIAAPDDSDFYMETPSLLSAVNPFTSDQRVQKSGQAAFRIDNSWVALLPVLHLVSLTELTAITRLIMMPQILKAMKTLLIHLSTPDRQRKPLLLSTA